MSSSGSSTAGSEGTRTKAENFISDLDQFSATSSNPVRTMSYEAPYSNSKTETKKDDVQI